MQAEQKRHKLPVLGQPSSVDRDGTRHFVYPADVRGRFTRLRWVVFPILTAIYVALPLIQIHGHPAVMLDWPRRQFFLFGATYNAQDFWLVFFLLSGAAFAIVVTTSLFGRIWCGYACPQTVFLDGFYRRIERLIEGTREQRLRRNRAPLQWDTLWRKAVKHLLFVALSVALSHILIGYFVSIPKLLHMMTESPTQNPEAFGWVTVFSSALYVNFAWFREQLCLVVCPYGRLQSALTDNDTITIGYDTNRGEPRGKKGDKSTGDCIDCNRCVVVCPTGIDIRNGVQLDCIGCAACIDACDEVMRRVEKPVGLIRYASLAALSGQPTRFLRPRVVMYAVLGVIGLVVASVAMSSRSTFEANLLRLPGAPFTLEEDEVRNGFELHLINKNAEPTIYRIDARRATGVETTIAVREIRLAPLASTRIPIFASVRRARFEPGTSLRVRVTPIASVDLARNVEAPIVGPLR